MPVQSALRALYPATGVTQAARRVVWAGNALSSTIRSVASSRSAAGARIAWLVGR